MTAGPGQPPESVLVDGWRVTLGPHGVVVTKSPPLPAGAPQPAVRVLPEPSMDLVGRHAELSAVLQALRAGSPVNVWGECGIGKTALLRVVAHRTAAEFGDRPVVFLTAARQPLEDLLHEIHRCLYHWPAHTKRRADEVRDELRRVQAVLVLDDVVLADADLADLLWTLRGSLVVVASPVRRQDPALRPIELDGLNENAAEQLFRRGLASRRLEAGEEAEVRRLVGPGILRGHPLRVQQAAALVESGRRSPGELVEILQFGDPAARLAQECQSALTPQQRQIVGVLALAAGAFLPTDLITQMCAVGQIITQLRSLRKSGVIDQRSDRFGLPVCSIGEPRKLVGPSVNTGLALRGLITWLQSPDTSAEGLLSVSGSILTVLEFAGEASEWDSVLRIVRAVEPTLITSGRWEQWHSALQSGLHAAEQLHEDLERAYHLHQLGSRALCLGDHVQAAQLLNEAESLRSRHGARDAARVTAHNLALITPRRWWQRPATIAAAAAAILVVGAIVAAAVLAGTSSSPSQSPSPVVPLPSATSSGSVPPTTPPPTTPPPTTPPPTTPPPTTPPPTTPPPTTPPPTTPPPTTPPPLR